MLLTAEGVFVAGQVLKQNGIEFLAAVVPAEIIAFTNTERANAQVNTVAESILLSAAAQAKAEDMAYRGYFAHVGPDGKEPWAWIEEAGYDYVYAGENLAVRFTESKDVVEAWMASPSHRANIIKQNYSEIGIGVAEGVYEGRPATFVVQYFGAPRAEALDPVVVATALPAADVTSEDVPPPALVPEVQGATAPAVAGTLAPAVASAQPTGSFQTYVRGVAEWLMRADTSALWLIGGVAGLLIVALALAFFIHLQVQPTDMLMGGATVAAIALVLVAANAYVVPSAASPQGAAVGMIMPEGVVDERAAFTEASF